MTAEENALRFQVFILPNLPWDQLLRRFMHAEELGFDLAVTADLFVDYLNPPGPWFELWSLLAGVAASTNRIRIAPCVAQIPLRNPAMFARQALTVDHISNGRLEIGLGLGLIQDPGYQRMGMPNFAAIFIFSRAFRYPSGWALPKLQTTLPLVPFPFRWTSLVPRGQMQQGNCLFPFPYTSLGPTSQT